jgi:DNA-directed RNA polymerase sigma subunit (sigma70/sigma32)
MKKIQNLCFEVHEQSKESCINKKCRYWIDCKNNNNCTLIAAKAGPMTLQDIGEIFGVTRMRICQLEKKIVTKLNQIVKRSNISTDNIL